MLAAIADRMGRAPSHRALRGFALAGVIGMQHGGVCWAGDNTVVDATGTMYGGAGTAEVGNNEGPPARYNERHFGVGALGILHPWDASGGAPGEQLGGFVQFGLVGELRAHELVSCGYSCAGDDRPGFISESHGGVRLGFGYDFRTLGLRGGALFTDSPNARVTRGGIPIPDVQFRFGPRSHGWFEVGLGAYDASTTFRPGVYIGGAAVVAEHLTLSGHYGWHIGIDEGEAIALGGRLSLGLDYAVRPNLRLGAGASLHNAREFIDLVDFTNTMVEGHARASFAF